MYLSKLQKAMAKWDGKINTEVDVKNMKIDACLLIGQGISEKFFDKTFGDEGKVKTVAQAQKYASDAAQGVGSFCVYSVHQAHRRLNKEED